MSRFQGSRLRFIGTVFLTLSTITLAQVDPKLKPYQPVEGISGSISSIGSDTLDDLMGVWIEGFKKLYPTVEFKHVGEGSGTAPPALAEGTSQVGPMSRLMTTEELNAFQKKKGYRPTEIGVALDALAVFVHKDNPVNAISLQQLDAIFSSSRKRGSTVDIDTWAKLDPRHPLKDAPITLFGRNTVSGTYGFFREHALQKGNYKAGVTEKTSSTDLVAAIAADPNGIGYSAVGFASEGVKVLKLSKSTGGDAIEGTARNVITTTYPLSRMLFIYVDKAPGKPLAPEIVQFLNYILSKDGQELVEKEKYFSLPAHLAGKNQQKFL